MTSSHSEPRRYYWDEEERVLRNKPKGPNWHLILVPESAYAALRQQLAEMRGALERIDEAASGGNPNFHFIRGIAVAALSSNPQNPNEPRCESCGGTTGFVMNRGAIDVCDDPIHDKAAALAPTSQPSRGKCETCDGSRFIAGPYSDVVADYKQPCPDCAQPSLPAGSLATAIEDAQRIVAGWPEDVRAAMGVLPEREGADIMAPLHERIQGVYTRAGRAAVCGIPDDSHDCDQMACSSVEHILARVPHIVDEKPAREPMTDWRNGENMAVQNKRPSFEELVDVVTGEPLHLMKRTYGGVTREQFEAAQRAAERTSPPQDDIVAGLRDCLIRSKPEGDEAIVPIKLWERAIAALERR